MNMKHSPYLTLFVLLLCLWHSTAAITDCATQLNDTHCETCSGAFIYAMENDKITCMDAGCSLITD